MPPSTLILFQAHLVGAAWGKGRLGEWECGHGMQIQRVPRVWGAVGRSWDGGSAPKLLCLLIYKVAHLLIPPIARDVMMVPRQAW